MKVDFTQVQGSHYEAWFRGKNIPPALRRIEINIRPIHRSESPEGLPFSIWIQTHCHFRSGRRSGRYEDVSLSTIGGNLDPKLAAILEPIYRESWRSLKPN